MFDTVLLESNGAVFGDSWLVVSRGVVFWRVCRACFVGPEPRNQWKSVVSVNSTQE